MKNITTIPAPTSAEPTGEELAFPGDYIAIDIRQGASEPVWVEGTILKTTGNCRTPQTTMYWLTNADTADGPYFKILASKVAYYRLTK